MNDKTGYTIIEIFVVVAILGILLMIAIPNFTAARDKVKKDACVNNLRQIKLAKEQWAIENNMDFSNTPDAANLNSYIRSGTNSLNCPLDSAHNFGTSYNIGNIGNDPFCLKSTQHRL